MEAKSIARWFLIREKLEILESGEGIQLSNLKLQKLLYYAQGICLAINKKPLFSDDIVAWQHGPVVEVVYREYKSNRGNIIKYRKEDHDEDIMREIQNDNKVRDILEFVFNEFGQYSAWKLRNMTHEERPWEITDLNKVISNDIIQNYFEEEVVEAV